MLRYLLFLFVLVLSTGTNGQSKFHRLLDQGGQSLLDGDIPQAKVFLQQALKIIPEKLDPEERSVFYNNLGVVYYQTGEYKQCIDWYLQELEIYRKAGNDSLAAGALHNLGLVYHEIGLSKKAMQELLGSARDFERLGNQKELASAWNSIGVMQLDLGNFEKALTYHERALRIREKIRYAKGIADSYNNIGDVHLAWKHYAKAEIYLQEALRQKKGLDNQSNLINTLCSLGKLYIAVGESKKAYSYLHDAYTIGKTIGNSPKVAESMCYLAAYYSSLGEEKKAMEIYHRTQTMARTSSDWTLLQDALQGEIALIENKRPGVEVVEKYRELLATKEKVTKELNSKELARLEISYDVERKNAELKLRRKQAKIDRLSNQRLTGWLVAVGGIALFAGLAFYQTQRRKKQEEILRKQAEDLQRQAEIQRDKIKHLHQELSHRTKNYFSMLSGILRSDRKKASNEEVIRVLDMNIHRLEAMSKVQGYLLVNSEQWDKNVQLDAYLNHLISELLMNLLPAENDLQLEKELDSIFIDYDKAMRIAIVLNELICNAIEHGLAGVTKPVLAISLKSHDNNVILTVQDNGPGLPEELLKSKTVKGRDIISKLLSSVNGVVTYHNENGCKAAVTIAL
ncbi:tetratricopeptide repeat protein [Fluviicola sp.]|uniref:tetratricopeptide repeat-containing sensor histidine kinase n=1 Tax=Fluviicola sp. TaxID=1917219 RepID=UPI0031D55C58